MKDHGLTISSSALCHNINFFRKLAPRSLFLAVIKSNAYGHGAKELTEILKDKVDFFGVNSLAEALDIRKIDFKTPVLIMGNNGFECRQLTQIEPNIYQDFHFVLSSITGLKSFQKIKKSEKGCGLFFHLKIDTGLSRLGIQIQDLPAILKIITENQELVDSWAGIMTHFANIEDIDTIENTKTQSYAEFQLKSFNLACKQLQLKNKKRLLYHSAASAATMLIPNSRLDLIRIGISLYGLWPSSKVQNSFIKKNEPNNLLELRPVLTWTSNIIHINTIKKGAYIGYGCTYRASQNMRVAIVPVGYYEGYNRALSNCGQVLIRGKRHIIIGRVSMNMICLDLSQNKEAQLGDKVVLIGKDGSDEITAESLANQLGTINYEIVTAINTNLNRTVVD